MADQSRRGRRPRRGRDAGLPARAGAGAVALAAGLVLLGGTAAPAAAQDARFEWRAPRWVGDLTFVGSNALLGGLTAGLMQKLEGGEFRDGFTRGAFGGSTAYLGRRIAVERFDGAGLLGRQVSAVGISVVRNAGEGRPSLERLVLPVGPARLHVDRSDGWRVRPTLGVRDLAWTLTFALRSETAFDWSASLSAGAPVFRARQRRFVNDEGTGVDGVQSSGVIGLSDVPRSRLRSAFAHERVHVLQHDFSLLVWSDPVERRLLERIGVPGPVHRHLDLGALFPVLQGAFYRALDVEHGRQLAEVEAMFLDRRRR